MMLANSFSNIPVFHSKAGKGRWMLLQDTAMMQWIRREPNKKKQKERLAMSVGEAITNHSLAVKGAICCSRETSIGEILSRMNGDPTLIIEKIEGKERLLGIITAFDLL
ncbi:MAG TPA: hypothetical protein VG077_11880 [Verrucomicrobiae bacterium]|nr:hypothetical protein [Verrucomicrobiae bacterium]